MEKMDNRYSPGMLKWNLRFGVTSKCNFRCRYCLPAGSQGKIHEPSLKDAEEVIQAAYNLGFRRIHYTGGEPTSRKDFSQILKIAQNIGFTQQIITTNGFNLYKNLDELIEYGLTRVIVSLDTLDSQRNLFVTRAKFFNETILGIEDCVRKLPTLTKMSCCTMKSTLLELKQIIAWAENLNNQGHIGGLAIKLNQFFPSNPVQLSDEGQDYWKNEFADEESILNTLREIGELKPVLRESIEGDNPSYNYYEVGNTGVKVAVLAMFSWGYPCGGCWKLRISPQGLATTCISQKNPPVLWGKSLEEKTSIIKSLLELRMSNEFIKNYSNKQHYRPQLGELRFDKVVGEEKSINHFEKVLSNETQKNI